MSDKLSNRHQKQGFKMEALVFNSSNEKIGSFRVDSVDKLKHGLLQLAGSHNFSSFDYIEYSGRTWTIIIEDENVRLEKGRVLPDSQSGLSNSSQLPRFEPVTPSNFNRSEVVVTDIDMPFMSMVIFMVKWVFASIPAFFIVGVIVSFIARLFIGF